MVRLKNFIDRFEKIMLAAAFAEAGEPETACRFLQTGKNANKKVLLGTDDVELNETVMRNALHLCRRIGAGLEILHLLRPDESRKAGLKAELNNRENLLTTFKDHLQNMGVGYELIVGDDCLAAAIVRHVRKRRDILCVVFEALAAGERHCQEAKQRMIAKLQELKCPVVVYLGEGPIEQ